MAGRKTADRMAAHLISCYWIRPPFHLLGVLQFLIIEKDPDDRVSLLFGDVGSGT